MSDTIAKPEVGVPPNQSVGQLLNVRYVRQWESDALTMCARSRATHAGADIERMEAFQDAKKHIQRAADLIVEGTIGRAPLPPPYLGMQSGSWEEAVRTQLMVNCAANKCLAEWRKLAESGEKDENGVSYLSQEQADEFCKKWGVTPEAFKMINEAGLGLDENGNPRTAPAADEGGEKS